MLFNQTVIDLLGQILQTNAQSLKKHLKVTQSAAQLLAYDQVLAEITKNKIFLGGVDMTCKLPFAVNRRPKAIESRMNLLIEKIGQSVTAINHWGISYLAKDFNQETDVLKQIATDSNWQLYEEKSSVKTTRWFFIGNRKNWHQPLFEIVLNQPDLYQQAWYPHLQIDLDTSLSAKDLDQLTTEVLNNNLVNWKKNYLQMFVLGEIEDIKIVLGIGSKARRIEKQRSGLFAWT